MPANYQDISIKDEIVKEKYKYSICTLVTDLAEYNEMLSAFLAAGFDAKSCEYRYIDNSTQNSFDAYSGLNLFLQRAQGEYIILCHQDILLNFDDRKALEKYLNELDELDSNWAIASNAGGIENDLYKRFAHNVVYADGVHHRRGDFPQKASAVDESFILVKKSANIALSANLGGFHLYGTDICLIAELLGYSAYIIDFKLTHKSYGSPGKTYHDILSRLIKKYQHFMRSRRILNTCGDLYLSSSVVETAVAESKLAKKISRKITKINASKNNK